MVFIFADLFVIYVFPCGELPVDSQEPAKPWRIECRCDGRQLHLELLWIKRSQVLHQLGQLCYVIRENLSLGCTHPEYLDSILANSGQLEQLLDDFDALCSIVITFQVMAVSEVSPKHQYTVKTAPQALYDVQRVNPSGTESPDNSDRRGVLESGHTGQIGAGVRAPVAEKCEHLWFKYFSVHLEYSLVSQ